MSKEIYDGGAVIAEDGVVYVDIPLILKRLGIPDTPATGTWPAAVTIVIARRFSAEDAGEFAGTA